MSRLIDADALKEHLFVGADYDKAIDDGIAKTEKEVFAFQCGWNDALKSVAQFAPTVDAVSVVRCKDCRHWIKDGKICCGQTTVGEDESSVITGENDFCSMGERWGERKEDGKID